MKVEVRGFVCFFGSFVDLQRMENELDWRESEMGGRCRGYSRTEGSESEEAVVVSSKGGQGR